MWATAKRRPSGQLIETAHLPAPMGGVNSVSSGTAMPPSDCIYAYNLIAGEFGLRSRLGFVEYYPGFTGLADNYVRTVIPFSGSTAAKNRVFLTTSTGIFAATTPPAGWAPNTVYAINDVVANNGHVYTCDTSGTSENTVGAGPSGTAANIADGTAQWDYTAPTPLVPFGIQTGRAGYGIPHAVIVPNGGGHFLYYADEENGLYLYVESTDAWTKLVAGVNPGEIDGVDPATIVSITVFKNRPWFVQRDTTTAFYLDAGNITGPVQPFDLAGKFKAGGHLVGLYNWTHDGGAGIDDALVAISAGGDVVVYQGTDPASATTFGLVGCWFVGGVVSGRRIATDYGGDLLILSILGVLPLSKLVSGASIEDQGIYATGKIANTFNVFAQTYKSLDNWAICIHPTENALLITVPTAQGQPTLQLAMSFATRAWSQYRDLPIFSAAVWDGELYFGTADGRLCLSSGYVDDVPLGNPSEYSPVAWSLLTSFTNGGTTRHKQVKMIQPTLVSQTPSPTVAATAKYDFDMVEPAAPALVGSNLTGTWDGSTWDATPWGGDYSPYKPLLGATGVGRDVAIALRGSAICRTALVSIDIFYETGGPL